MVFIYLLLNVDYFHVKATNEVITRVPESTQDEMEAATAAAARTFPAWSEMSVMSRQQVMFKYQQLIKENQVMFL